MIVVAYSGPAVSQVESRKRWILAEPARGDIQVDEGAAQFRHGVVPAGEPPQRPLVGRGGRRLRRPAAGAAPPGSPGGGGGGGGVGAGAAVALSLDGLV